MSSFSSLGTPLVINQKKGVVNNSKGKSVSNPQQNQNSQTKYNFLSSPINIPSYSTGGSTTVLRYPLDRVPDLGYDYVTFSAYEYKACVH